ncbi:MAG: hypothetical protein IJ354_10580 [Clostridia bacterium]|nr:hypothetical protein [Clostridia bacterium]
MKLSEMKTDVGFQAMTAMLPHMQKILSDPAYSACSAKNSGGKVIDLAAEMVPMMLLNHREEVYGIISAVTGESSDEIQQKPLAETLGIVEDAFSNDVLRFFSFCAHLALKT